MDPIKCIRTYADPEQIGECRKRIETNEPAFTQLAGFISLAGNEVRLKMLYLLDEEGELCPCDIADILNMTVPAISQHLRKLKEGQLIKARKSGNLINYSLEAGSRKILNPFFKYIDQMSQKEIA